MAKIKKRYKLLILLYALFFALVTIVAVLQYSKVQTALIRVAMNKFLKDFEPFVSINSFHYSFYSGLNVKELTILDFHNDTLLKVHLAKININFRKSDFKNGKIIIKTAKVDQADVRLVLDTTGVLNLQALLDKYKKPNDTVKAKTNIRIENILLTNSDFSLTNLQKIVHDTVNVDYGAIDVNDINARLKDFVIIPDSVSFNVRKIKFMEASGFVLNEMNTVVSISKNHLIFDKLRIITPNSFIAADSYVKMYFSDWTNYRVESLYDSVRFSIKISSSIVSIPDIRYFAPKFPGVGDKLSVSGSVYGPLSNFKGKDISLEYKSQTSISGNFNIMGLPVFKDSYMYLDIDDFTTTLDDIDQLANNLTGKPISFPQKISRYAPLHYHGKFTGFLTDFVAYGSLRSEFGNFTMDIALKPNNKNFIEFEGSLKATDFAAGKFFKIPDILGNTSFEANTSGTITGKNSYFGKLTSTIQTFDFNKYTYQNLSLSGDFSNDYFDGKLIIKDPNVDLDFNGRIDFADSLQKYDFTANINRANLFRLNIDRSDSTSFASFFIKAKATGKNLDELDGEVELINSFLSKSDKQLQVYDLLINANNNKDQSKLVVTSDFINLELYGDYKFGGLKESFLRYLSHYVKSYNYEGSNEYIPNSNDFNFRVKLINPQPLADYFLPSLKFSPNSTIEGVYSPDKNIFYIKAEAPYIGFNTQTFDSLILNVSSDTNRISVEAGSKNFRMGRNIDLGNFTFESVVEEDSIILATRWNNWDTILNKGSITANLDFLDNDTSLNPVIKIILKPSDIIINNNTWSLQKSTIDMFGKTVSFNNFKISNKKQILSIDGTISEKKNDTLYLDFENYNLNNINVFTSVWNLDFGGVINGTGWISDFYHSIIFDTDFRIDSLELNSEVLGNSTLRTIWDNKTQRLNSHLIANRGNLKTLIIDGYYEADTKTINYEGELEKLKLNIFSPYVASIFSDIKGIASGNVSLTGTLKNPSLNGQFDIKKASMKVDYLKTRYNIADQLQIMNNIFYFKNAEIFDDRGDKAILNGTINYKGLKELSLNLDINATNFCFLNTTEADNPDFYGIAYGTGDVTITGTPANLYFTAQVKSESDTKINIPVSKQSSVQQYSFISFKSSNNTYVDLSNYSNYKVDLSGFQIDLNFELTPDAELQIIFDEKLGDIMKGRGNGNIKLEINTLGKFNMYGDFNITSGEYLFTLQNVINKKFVIQPGGTIIWDGKPLDAELDIDAIYKLKASLYELFYDEGNEKYKSRIPVECHLKLSSKLLSPVPTFSIVLPNSDAETQSKVQSAINTEEEMNKQFFSLLVINSFFPDPNKTQGSSSSGNSGVAVAGVTTTEMLSNQLSNWLSQWSNDIDIGVNYRFGDQISQEEWELALSTQLFNDRLLVNGSIDYGGNVSNSSTASSSAIAGDIELDYLLNKNWSIRAYNKANDRLSDYYSDYTQGFGISYKEEFNSWHDVFNKYWKLATFQKDSTKAE